MTVSPTSSEIPGDSSLMRWNRHFESLNDDWMMCGNIWCAGVQHDRGLINYISNRLRQQPAAAASGQLHHDSWLGRHESEYGSPVGVIGVVLPSGVCNQKKLTTMLLSLLCPWVCPDKALESRFQRYLVQNLIDRTKPIFAVILLLGHFGKSFGCLNFYSPSIGPAVRLYELENLQVPLVKRKNLPLDIV